MRSLASTAIQRAGGRAPAAPFPRPPRPLAARSAARSLRAPCTAARARQTSLAGRRSAVPAPAPVAPHSPARVPALGRHAQGSRDRRGRRAPPSMLASSATPGEGRQLLLLSKLYSKRLESKAITGKTDRK